MFMRYQGGGIGHKSIREATLCLFDDRDALDKQEFSLEHDRNLFDEEAEDTDDDVPMDESNSSDEESGDESESEELEMEDIDPACSEHLIDDELGDEMDEYGYSGLDQVLEVEDDAEVSDDEDALGPEDGENPDDGLKYGEL